LASADWSAGVSAAGGGVEALESARQERIIGGLVAALGFHRPLDDPRLRTTLL
jgi:hypothetical protein